MQEIRIDFVSNTIIVTKSFIEAAADMTSDEYVRLKNAQLDNPSMRIVTRTCNSSNRVSKSKGLTYAYMRNFIKIMDSANRVVFEDAIDYYNNMYQGNTTKTYAKVRDWFLENYPEHEDMIVDTAPKRVAA